jgi:putative phosphoesterase
MHKYIVFSDIHTDGISLIKIKKLLANYDGVFFAGDGYSLAKALDAEAVAVGGNCDLSGAPEIVTEIEGVRIFLTHGHRYGVKSSLLSLTLRAKELDCAVAIFGHTHQPFCSYENGVFLFNPGASSGWGRKTYGVLTLDNGQIKADVLELK